MRGFKPRGIWGKDKLSITVFLKNVFKDKGPEVGAVACFFGVVRGYAKSGEAVRKLETEAYREVAEEAFNRIAEDVKKKHGVREVYIGHVTGSLNVGDLIMAVAVAGSSRSEVFPALEDTVEMVKSEAAIWKKEYLRKGEEYWVTGEGLRR
ncbi:MAG: molybdenum cofactor biosynthesis protein MoaE [Candidatus Bathyarchaeia archaeon]